MTHDDLGTVALELGGRIPPRLIGIAWLRDRYRSPTANAFVETAREVCAEPVSEPRQVVG